MCVARFLCGMLQKVEMTLICALPILPFPVALGSLAILLRSASNPLALSSGELLSRSEFPSTTDSHTLTRLPSLLRQTRVYVTYEGLDQRSSRPAPRSNSRISTPYIPNACADIPHTNYSHSNHTQKSNHVYVL